VSNAIPNYKPFIAATPGGDIKITHYKRADLFDWEIQFFLLISLTTFDAILGKGCLSKGERNGSTDRLRKFDHNTGKWEEDCYQGTKVRGC